MKITIKTGLTVLNCVIAAAFCIYAGIVYIGLHQTDAATRDIGENWLPSVRVVGDLKTAFFEKRLAYSKHIIALTPADLDKAEKLIASTDKLVDDQITAYRPLISSERERALIEDIQKGVNAYDNLALPMLEKSRQQQNDDASKIFSSVMAAQGGKNVEMIDELRQINLDGASRSVGNSASAFALVNAISAAAAAVVLSLLVFGTIYGRKGISVPLSKITALMKRLAAGEKDLSIPYLTRHDEIGDIATSLDVFRQNAVEKENLERLSEQNRSVAETERQRNLQIERQRSEELQFATANIATALQHLAQGDLSFSLGKPFADEYESLRVDFNAAVEQLSKTLGAVALSIRSIDAGSVELSTGAEDLSKRTEQQAASLEETAAALDQITANVLNASKRAEEARAVAVEANDSTRQSGQVVANAVDAMHRIEQSSAQISSIIGVIDEIAFQTNLLALNAGVEAARAGEAGKGFAVVAQEVRELAQRSAKAAKEIKELIHNSEAEVENGVVLVRATGEALKSIGAHVATINVQLDSIATSAKEQSVGLAEVNTAVNQMDQVTQQNAAMVEQSTAASATLSADAQRLGQLIGQFKLGQHQVGTISDTPLQTISSGGTQSPALRLIKKVQQSVGGGHGHAAAQSWEEF